MILLLMTCRSLASVELGYGLFGLGKALPVSDLPISCLKVLRSSALRLPGVMALMMLLHLLAETLRTCRMKKRHG